jgi:flagellar hook protein FlgE
MGYEQGLSGLSVSSTDLDVIGNNIANSSTVGFKAGDAQFASVYASSLAQSSNLQVGIGSQVSSVANSFTQGNITQTGKPLDVAINGGGFFIMSNNGSLEYTRDGQFHTDNNGNIVDASGAQLQGYPVNAQGVATSATPQALQIPTTNIPPKASTEITAQFNLDSRDTAPTISTFSPGATGSYNNTSAVTVYDSLGNPQNLSLYFVKSGTAGTWNVYATNNGTALPSQGVLPASAGTASTYSSTTAPGTLTSIPAGGLTIDGTAITLPAPGGNLTAAQIVAAINGTAGVDVTASVSGAGITLTGNTNNGTAITVAGTDAATIFGTTPTAATGTAAVVAGTAAPAGFLGTASFNTAGALTGFANTDGVVGTVPGAVAITIPAGTGGSATPLVVSLNLTGTTQYGQSYNPSALNTDGYTSGALTGYNIGTTGLIQGEYSNGQSQTLGQIALATFTNQNGLVSSGNNYYLQSAASGQPVVGLPGGTNLGSLESGATESSNVDLTTQLVDLITAQRDYQANAQTIKTQQAVDQTLFNL